MEQCLYVVIPAYNEEEVIEKTASVLQGKIFKMMQEKQISSKSRVLFVDDGSNDKTWKLISKIHELNPMFVGIRLSKNMGHQYALLAGLMKAKNMRMLLYLWIVICKMI